jgi:hypothetical protein
VTQLNQLVAVEKGVKAKAQRALTDAYHAVQRTTGLSGIARTYQPKDDEGDQLPPESTLVQVKAADVIAAVEADLVRLFDVTATKDATNAVAKADVVVDGQTLVKDATVPFLLFLEKQLVDVRSFVNKLPVLDPSERWSFDSNQGAYATEPSQTTRTKKVPRNWVKAEATDKHPAQVEIFHEVGTWTTVKYSGALPQTRVNELLARVDKLVEAVKFARESANTATVVDQKVGAKIFGYLFGN